MEIGRREQRNRLLTASLRLALTNMLSTGLTRPHVKSVFAIDPSMMPRQRDQATDTHGWISSLRRYLTPTSMSQPKRLVSGPTASAVVDSQEDQAASMPEDASMERVTEDLPREISVPTACASTIRPRKTRMPRVDSGTDSGNILQPRSSKDESELPSQSLEARGTLSDSTTLVSLDLSPAIAQVIQPLYSTFTSPTTDSSSFPSVASPCIRIDSNLLEGVVLNGSNSPQILQSPQELAADTNGTVLRRTRRTRASEHHRSSSGSQSPAQQVPSLPRSASTDFRREGVDNLKTWLHRLAVNGALESSPSVNHTAAHTLRRISTRSTAPTAGSSSHGSISSPATPSQYLRETYPRTRLTPGRIIYKAPATPSVDEQARPKPGEFRRKPRLQRCDSFDSLLTGTPDAYTYALRSRTSRRLRELFAKDDANSQEGDYESTPEQRRVSESTVDAEGDDVSGRFMAAMATLRSMYGQADMANKSRITDDVERMLKALGPNKAKAASGSGSRSRTQSNGQSVSRGRSPRLKKQSSEVSIIKGKHGDENYFGQAVLSPAFI
ncbi:hypothetical protein EJ05DRAFT_489673 [Pseudovirgaria hyperparasitica]|uniref:Uncharacterized protein n=1 Tax=Pseudovirgaria hyperparasitica TaxID=470096 RepID=A0A6A6VXI3_9PEZI|nr:uncharacterized protein EJ05DRAFT_489673 [Pseudovirgaria hyperparasitica]KAF2753961.1 hypothetical protein EJ05DRAFT_489673 [Pseudovirgaria hyperparasitica]